MSKLTLFAAGVAAGAFFMPMFGFVGLGWKLDSKAQVMASEAASAELRKVLVPACVARFNADPEADMHRTAMKEIKFFHPRMLYVEKGGWAVLPGQENASRGVARGCTELLVDAT